MSSTNDGSKTVPDCGPDCLYWHPGRNSMNDVCPGLVGACPYDE